MMSEYNIDLNNIDPRSLPDLNALPWRSIDVIVPILFALTSRANLVRFEIMSMEHGKRKTASALFQNRSLEVMREYADDLDRAAAVWKAAMNEIMGGQK